MAVPELVVSSGQTSGGLVADSNLWIYVFGTVNNTSVNSGGDLAIDSGGAASNTTISYGDQVNVYGGVDFGATIKSGGSELVETTISGVHGSAVSTTINSGGVQYVYSGGIVTGTVFNGGEQQVLSGAVVDSADVIKGIETILSGGMTMSTAIASGAYQVVWFGGTASATQVPAAHWRCSAAPR